MGHFPFPPPGGKTYCPSDVFSYTSQAPTQPPPTAPAAHPLLCFTVNTPNSMLLLLGASPLCRWARSPTCSWGTSHLASCVLPQAWQQQRSRRLGTATAPATWRYRRTLCRYLHLITHLVQPYSLAKRATGSFKDRFLRCTSGWSTSDTGMQGM